MTAQTISKTKSLKCSHDVRNIPLERFRLPDDGRKWKQAARSRSALLCRLATYANADGTFMRDSRNYSPSLKTLLNHLGHGSYYRLTDDLHGLGLLSWKREKHYERRVYTIHVPEQVPDSQEDPLETGPAFDDEEQQQVPHSPITGPTLVNNRSHHGQHPSLPPEEPSKERAAKRESPAAPALALSSKPKPTASDRKYAQDLVQEIKKIAMDASEGKAVFYGTNGKALEAIILEHNPDRDSVLTAVRTRVLDMEGDSFRLAHCGGELAECLTALVQYKLDQRAADAQRERDIARSIAVGVAQDELERKQRLAASEEEEAAAARFGDRAF